MKQGDIVKRRTVWEAWQKHNPWMINPLEGFEIFLVLSVTKTKKTWHRKINLYSTKTLSKLSIKWSDRHSFENVYE